MSSPGFEEFVAARSARLLRTAYLLTCDHALAEDLLQTALTKAYLAWSRIDGDPEPYVRRILVTTYASWWRRKWNGEQPTETLPETPDTHGHHDERTGESGDLWDALGRLPRKQRAVVVLRCFEDLTEPQTADLLGISTAPSRARPARHSPSSASIRR